MAAHKGSAKVGGRTKGTPNKATADVKALALSFTEATVRRLAWLTTNASSEAAQVAACKEILDRAVGKAPQAITGEDGGEIAVRFSFNLDKANKS